MVDTTDLRFVENIAKLQQRRRLKYSSQFILYTLSFFWLLHAVVLAVEKSGWYHIERTSSFYLLCSFIALLAAASLLFIKKQPLSHLLIEMDDRFDLHDRLSTAYEYQRVEKESLLSASLMQDAVRSLKRFSMKELLPLNLSRLYLILLLVGMLNLLLLFAEKPVFDTTSIRDLQETEPDRENDKVQKPGESTQRDKKLQEEEKDASGYRRLREKIEELRQQTLSPQQRTEKIQGALQEVQGMQENLSEASPAENGSTNLENLPIRQVPLQRKTMMANLQTLEDILQRMLSENGSGSDTTQELSAQLQEQLSELLEKLDGRQFDSSQEEKGADVNDDTQGSGASSSESSDKKEAQDGEQESGSGDENDDQNRSTRRGGGMADIEQEGEMNDSRQQSDGSRASVESGVSTEESPPSAPETSGNPIVQDKIRTAEQEQYNVHIRSVTEIGKARLPEEDLTRPYRREVESILQQEDMPLNYREYIKNYFLSIGLTEEAPTGIRNKQR